MLILKNAVESIQVGVEDFENQDERRSVSAMRNIAAGLLLLFKTKLCQLSPASEPELLIKKDLVPAVDSSGNLFFSGKGRKTVDVAQIRERLVASNVDVDWKRVDEITSLRNDIEHHYAKVSPDAVREVVAKSFLIIRDFSQNALDLDPQELLGAECWQVLLKAGEVYLAEEKLCQESLSKVNWKYHSVERSLTHLRCPACSSALIEAPESTDQYPGISLRCKSCGEEFDFDDVVENCIDELFAADSYRRIKDGGEPENGRCPHCDRDTFVLAENRCVACEGDLDYTECSRCGESLSLEDQDLDGMCGYCKHQFNKMMAE